MTPKHLLIADCSEMCYYISLLSSHPILHQKYQCFLIFHSCAAEYKTPPTKWCLLDDTERIENLRPANVNGENLVVQINWKETPFCYYTVRYCIWHHLQISIWSPDTRIFLYPKPNFAQLQEAELSTPLLTNLKHTLSYSVT